MEKAIMRIGISGGTFDPIHFGHLIVAEDIRQKFELDTVLFIPTGKPPHKNLEQVTNTEHRLNMLKRAISSNPYFEIDDLEIKRSGYTYTIDTLNSLKEKYSLNTKFYYIVGADTLHELKTWKNYKEVFKICEFVVALRPGYLELELQNVIEELKQDYGALISTAYVPQIGISSTLIRKKIREQKSIKYLVPELVEEYILDNKLYSV